MWKSNASSLGTHYIGWTYPNYKPTDRRGHIAIEYFVGLGVFILLNDRDRDDEVSQTLSKPRFMVYIDF